MRRGDRYSQVANAADTERLPDEPKNLQLRGVSFRYTPEADDAVREVTLDIPFGSQVAFVGASGAGKSTMIDLLLGLVDPTSGVIQIDGVPLKPWDVEMSVGDIGRTWAIFPDEVERQLAENLLALGQKLQV